MTNIQGLRLKRVRFAHVLSDAIESIDELTNRERIKFRLIMAARPAARYAFRRWAESERGTETDNGMVAPQDTRDWLDWLIENGPALIEFIRMLIDLFGSESNSLVVGGSQSGETCQDAIADCLKQAEALVACLTAIDCPCEPTDPDEPDPPAGDYDYNPDTASARRCG